MKGRLRWDVMGDKKGYNGSLLDFKSHLFETISGAYSMLGMVSIASGGGEQDDIDISNMT